MGEINHGGPAFPKTGNYSTDQQADYDSVDQSGMTLRQWYAGQALPELIRQCGMKNEAVKEAFWFADAMIAFEASALASALPSSPEDGR
jgi:hypothetical protein